MGKHFGACIRPTNKYRPALVSNSKATDLKLNGYLGNNVFTPTGEEFQRVSANKFLVLVESRKLMLPEADKG